MRTFFKIFLRGVLAFLPIFLTLYAVWHLGRWLNEVTHKLMAWLLPGAPDLPGIGIVVGIVVISALGVLVSSRMTSWVYRLVEAPLRHTPIVKDLYAALKQLTTLLSPRQDTGEGRVVTVSHPALPVSIVGLMTRSSVADLPDGIAPDDTVAVYLPMSYQIGGYTLFVPRDWVKALDMPVETAMRNALTGWVETEHRRRDSETR